MDTLTCFRCGEVGHWRDHCRFLLPPKTRGEHQQRIQLFIDRMVSGQMTVAQKRAAVEAEHALWNEARKKRAALAKGK